MHRTSFLRWRLHPAIPRALGRSTQIQTYAQWSTRRPVPTRPLLRAPALSRQQRLISYDLKNEVKKAWKEHRIAIVILVVCIGVVWYALALSVVQYFQLYWLPQYPQPVQTKLRRAIYYKIIDFKPQQAIDYLKEALVAADECGMDPYSDAVIGIRVQAVEVMEKIEAYKEAVKLLEHMIASTINVTRTLEQSSKVEDQVQRTRLLLWSVRFAVKLGELYGRPEVWDRTAADAHFEWAATTVLKEAQRRAQSHIGEEDEGPWMSTEELGATFEKLAFTYESKNQHYFAAPLFLQAINLRTVVDCHTVVLMNNLASSLSQQSPQAAMAVRSIMNAASIDSDGKPLTRDMLLDFAATWAQNALDVAAQVKPPVRDEECDLGCAVALHNLGEIAEMKKDFETARKRYQEAVSLARAVGFQEGVEQSNARLSKLKGSVT